MGTTFYSWIESKECLDVLAGCAKQVALRASQMGILLEDAYLEQECRADFNKAVAADLWQFLKINAEQLSSKATTLLVSGDTRKFATFIVSSFLDYCLDKRRTDSPFHAYYRHMRTVLSQADDIQYRAEQRRGAYYAWCDKTDLTLLPDTYEFNQQHLNYTAWAASTVPFSDIHEKPAMLKLSRHYWDEALQRLVQLYLLPIRGLVAFVATKYPLIPKQTELDHVDGNDEDENAEGRLGRTIYDHQQQMPQLPIDIIDTALETLARDCANELTATERTILIMQAEQQTLNDIARHLGMKGASNVSYHQEKAYRKLRLKWSLWALPDSEHYSVAAEEQELFFKKVIAFCKDLDACRDNNHGENS
jgi:hypothetical protein